MRHDGSRDITQGGHTMRFVARKYRTLLETDFASISVAREVWRSRDGAVVRALAAHQCGPGSIPGLGVICGLSLLLVLVLAPRGFSPGTPVFLSPQKPIFLHSNSVWRGFPYCKAHMELYAIQIY